MVFQFLLILSSTGGLQSVRFTFVTANQGWTPSEDAYAAFNREKSNSLFVDESWVEYSLGRMDYTWNVIRHERGGYKFTGRDMISYREFCLFIIVCVFIYFKHAMHISHRITLSLRKILIFNINNRRTPIN